MSINFSEDRWERVREVYADWWNRKIDRPVVGVAIQSRIPKMNKPKYPIISQVNCNDLSIKPEQIIEGIEYQLATYEFYGDAFPMFSMDCFGPGIVAGMLGAKLDNRTGNVWFMPEQQKEISELEFKYNPDNIWLQRIKKIYKEGLKRFEGNVLLSMPDLGSSLDVLAAFRPGERLLLDLYDEPDEVLRVLKQIDVLWIKFYEELAAEMQASTYGYTDWSTIYSAKPSYVVQCDFSYMIGTEMFEEFAFESIKKQCNYLGNSMFHLDGPGELRHLEKILSIESLDAIQWVPGEGNPKCDCYIEEYNKILQSRKQVQIPGQGFEVLYNIIEQTGNPGAYQHMMMYMGRDKEEYALEWLKHFKIEKW